MSFIIFFSIVITIYILGNFYVFQKGMLAVSAFPIIKKYFTFIFWTLALSYPVARIVERVYLSYFSDILLWIGSFWLAMLLYFFLICLLIDMLRLLNYLLPNLPSLFQKEGHRLILFWSIIAFVSSLVAAGYYNAINPVVRNVEIDIPKDAGDRKSLHAVLISDIHLGTMIGNGRLKGIVSKINDLSPEIVFIAGDLVDEDLKPVLRQNIGYTLKDLQAPLGVYAITGNHEYIGGANDAIKYLEEHGITFIRDTALIINNSFYLIGREDRDMARFKGEKRKPLQELTDMADNNYPVILMDHQPFYLDKAANAGVDLQLSGHTHHGQIWPLNYITSAMYDISRGYGKAGNMHVYVTSGIGTWGPPVRIGSKPEIIDLRISFIPGQ